MKFTISALVVVLVFAASNSPAQKVVRDKDQIGGVAAQGNDPLVFDGGKNEKGMCQIIATRERTANGVIDSAPFIAFFRPEKSNHGGAAWGEPMTISYTDKGALISLTNKKGKRVHIDLEKLAEMMDQKKVGK